MRKAIVTGATGFIAKYLIEELTSQGYEVWAIVRNEKSDVKNIAPFKPHIVYCDLNKIDRLIGENLIPVDTYECFYHLAWTGNSGEERGDYKIQLDTVKYTVQAAYIAKELGCKKIVVSGSVTQLMYRDYLRQDCITPEIVTCYAVGRMAAESFLKCLCPSIGIEYGWAYIANIYGAGDKTNNFVNYLIQNYSKGITPELTPGEQLADFIYVSDVARGLRYLAERGKKNTSYYIGYGSPKPLKEFVEVIHRIIAPEIESGIGRKAFNGMDIAYDKIDYLKFNRETGFKANVAFDVGIRQVIDEKST